MKRLGDWLAANAVALVLAIAGAGVTGGGWLVARARADDRIEAIERGLVADKADLAKHEVESARVHEQTQRDIQTLSVLIRDAAWNGYFVCLAQAKRPDLECSKPAAPR